MTMLALLLFVLGLSLVYLGLTAEEEEEGWFGCALGNVGSWHPSRDPWENP